jgi:hypothetical protein
MMSRLGLLMVLIVGAVSVGQNRARAAAGGEDTEEPKAAGDAAAAPAAPMVIVPANAGPPPTGTTPPAAGVFGIALRTRYVSVPGWLLGLFTKHNMPLSTFAHYGVEGFRRRGNFQMAVALSYQNMSPPDGNWLGSKHDPTIDTRFLRFRGLALYSADVSFIWQSMVSSWFGLHAGAGLGVAIVGGSVYIDPSSNCTDSNLNDLSVCHPTPVKPVTCANGACTPEANLSQTPTADKLPVIPVINMVFGVDFRLPNLKGWEAKLEGGFYDAFFAGLGIGYTF